MKILATDFDETLFTEKDYYRNIEYVNKFVDQGNLFVIATGRYKDHLLKDISNTNLKFDYLICNDGGIIFDKDLNIVYQKDIPLNIVDNITNIIEKSPCIYDWYIDTGLTITKDKNSNANGIIGRFNDRDKAIDILLSITNKYSEIHGYISSRWINITEKTVNKGSSLLILTKLLNINNNDVYTIGDNVNDISMSNYGFNNYSMSNSIDELKEITIKSYNKLYELIDELIKKGS